MSLLIPARLKNNIFIIAFSLMLSNYAFAQEKSESSIKNITRLQLRESSSGSLAWSQSTYAQWPNKFYLLELYDREYETSYQPWHLDINAGQPIGGLSFFSQNDLLDWVARSQTYFSEPTVLSAGLQFNFTNIPDIKSALNEKTQSFVQVFPVKTNENLGMLDLLHYYNIPVSSNVSIRGYNQYIVRENQTNLFYPWVDTIYSVNHDLDIYTRISYLSSNDPVLGTQGFEYWLGIRINL